MAASREIDQLLQVLDQAYDRKSWHGTNLRGSLRSLSPRAAAWRPAPGHHNVWELVVHAAYWKYVVRRRLLGEQRGSFALDGSNWFVRPEADRDTDAAWRADLALLGHEHRLLREAVAAFPARKLRERSGRSRVSPFDLIAGVAAHDLYHAGQIQLLKKQGRGTR